MPNHVTHRVVVTGPAEEVARFREKCIREKTETSEFSGKTETWTLFDFESLIPMPAILHEVPSSSTVDDGLALLDIVIPGDRSSLFGRKTIQSMLTWPWVVAAGITNADDLKVMLIERNPDCIKQAIAAYKAYKETGHKDWYGWSIANWGTKWNSYSYSEIRYEGDSPDADVFEFQFDTAWNTPDPIWEALAKEFPELTFEVSGFDEGWNFAVSGQIIDGINAVESIPATPDMYQTVYGEWPEALDDEGDDEGEEASSAA